MLEILSFLFLAEHRYPQSDPVKAKIESGIIFVNISNQKFKQVDPDRSQEWLNGNGRKGGGIVGITTPTLSRWTFSSLV
jgi:hypothetical protein